MLGNIASAMGQQTSVEIDKFHCDVTKGAKCKALFDLGVGEAQI
jgi:hypothetical protein